jgi:hypothetical protein
MLSWRVLWVPCRQRPRYIATYVHAAERHVEQAASTLPAGLATVCGLDDACLKQGSLERSRFVESEALLLTSCHISIVLGWRGSVRWRVTTGVPFDVRRHGKKIRIVNAVRMSLEFDDLVREGYSHDLFYRDEGEWARDSRIGAIAYYFWRLNRLCIPLNSGLRVRLIFGLHDSSPTSHIGVFSTLANALDRFLWKRIRQDDKDFVNDALCVDELKFNPIWLRLFTLYMFHPDRSTLWDLTT